MKQIKIGKTSITAPSVAVGCMRISSLSAEQAAGFVSTALNSGLNFFDHADIYGGGKSEEVFASAARSAGVKRENVILQSKCGIRKDEATYDFSKQYILDCVDGILSRLDTDYLDILLLHRPDALTEPEEVARAFERLEKSGKVKYFGVSNHTPMQIDLLKKFCGDKIHINQLQLSITNSTMIQSGLNANTEHPYAVDRDGGVLDYCRLNDITVQAWSPFQYGFFEGVFIGSDKYPALNTMLEQVGEKYGVSATTIALAWILRHPANIQAVTGTTKPARLLECARAMEIELTRKEWYDIYKSAGNKLL